MRAWVEPENWQPVWTDLNENGIYGIANVPTLQVAFQMSREPSRSPNYLGIGRIWAYYDPEDQEHKRFLNFTKRVIKKLATDHIMFRAWNEPEYRELPHINIWFGLHALEWCRADPKRVIDEYYRPVD